MQAARDYRDWAMDDIVFENRNKTYGSYQNKKAIPQNVIIGLATSVLCFVMLALALTVNWHSLGQITEGKENITPVNHVHETTVNLPPPPALLPVLPPPVRPSVRFTEMVVREEPEIEEDEYPGWVEEMQERYIALVTKVGDTTVPLVVRDTLPPVVKEVPLVDTPVYESVDQRPEFPGGDEALVSFVQSRIIYPEADRIKGAEGKVHVVFVVKEDGSVSDARVAIGVSPGLNKEALRVVKMLPKFRPGLLQGRAVRVYFHIPVSFAL